MSEPRLMLPANFELRRVWIGAEEQRAGVRLLLGDWVVVDVDPTIGSRTVVFQGIDAFGRVESMRWILRP